MEFIDLAVKLPTVYVYFTIIVLLSIILLLKELLNIWKTGKRYSHLPTYHNIVFEELYRLLAGKTHLSKLPVVMFQKLDGIAKQFEKEGMSHIWCFRHILVIFGEESVKVFATDEASSNKSPDYEVIKEGIGEGLIASNGETWKKDRKLINPVFHIRALKAKLPIFNKNAKSLVEKFAKLVDKPTADVLPAVESFAFRNVCEAVFGISSTDVGSDREIERAYQLMTGLQKYMVSRWVFSPIVAMFYKYLTPSGWKSSKSYKEIKQYGLKIISPTVDSFSLNSRDTEKDLDGNQKFLLDILLQKQLKEPSVTSNYVLDHSNTMLAAGAESVVSTITWSLYLLGLNKDVQERAYDEIRSVVDEFVTYENICQLEYLECIIKETLRLYPTVPIFARQLKTDMQCGKYTVPKDTTVLFFLYRLHRNPEIYPDPEKYDPDRFLSSNAAERRRWFYIPFSEGYRNCIGKKFAMMETKVILAHILRNYEVTSLDRREDLELKWNFILMPKKRLRMRITRREIIPEVSCVTKERNNVNSQ